MKKSRKAEFLSIILIAVVLFAGCRKELPENNEEFEGSGAASIEEMVPEKNASLVFWTGNKEYGEAIAKAFTAKYGVPCTPAQEGMGTIDKIALSGPGGEGADVFMTAHDNFEKGLSAGVFMKLEDAVVKNITDKISESGILAVTSKNSIYGIPVSIEVNSMYYNKDIIETPAQTLEEIMDAAKDFNVPEQNKFLLLCTIGDGYTEYPFMAAEGFQLFGQNGDDADNPGFDTEEYERGLALLASLHDTMPINSTDLNNKSSVKATFIEGKAGYFISGPWDVKQIKESGLNFGITTMPTYKGRQLTPFAGVQCAHISPFTKYPIAAQLLASFLVSEEGASILYDKYDGITTLKDISNVKGLAEDEYLKPFVKQFEHSVPMPSAARVSFYWSISQDINRAVFDGKLSPAEGRKKTIENWKALLATE